jgi:hypothetical protein
MKLHVVMALAFAAVLAAGAPSRGQAVTAAADPVILIVDGKTGDGKPISFTLSQIEAMGVAKIVTHTPWHDGQVTFEGVPMAEFLAKVGAKGDMVNALALDKFSAEMPIADLVKYHAVMAYKTNGKIMTIADKGPLFIVYPYDSDPDLATETFYSRSPWQIARLTIE